ncbi:Gti1/Pac2 family-domain-containing protein [Parasitella parasitica]|nr:Gti1/Pac2 family-domain-containing protein [Parasitella parasitica]
MTSLNVQKNAPVAETFYGYIETTRDSLLLFEACKRGLLPRITRRLQDKERILIRSGTIFCFDERESGIKRWTDGLMWSPSRILGNFLIYRELQDKNLTHSNLNASSVSKQAANNNGGYLVAPDLLRRQQEKALVGSLKTSFKFKRNGLIKKSMSLVVDGVQQHIISYYNKEDVLTNRLRTPSSLIELSSLEVSPGLRLRQNFRIPASQGHPAQDSSTADDNGMKQVTQMSTNKRKYSDYKSSSPTSYASSNSSGSSVNSESQCYTLQKEAGTLLSSNKMICPVPSSKKSKRNESLYPSFPVVNHASTGNVSYPALESSVYQPPLTPQDTLADLMFVQCKTKPITTKFHCVQQANEIMSSNNINTASRPDKYPASIISPSSSHDGGNMYIEKKNSNRKHISSPTDTATMNSSTADYSFTSSKMGMIASGTYYAPFRTDDYYEGQNPHQHLFSSSSFHTVNHASIIPNRSTDITANAFMEDISVLLGTGWNEFELQM